MSDWFPPPSRPRAVDGGLKSRSTRGAIAQTWWSQRFIAVLESMLVGGRLQRGRNYARRGQVISMEVGPGSVTAKVQGSRAKPYDVRIGIAEFGEPQWLAVEAALVENAWYTAALLAGEMPEDIEDVFSGVGLSLFPAGLRDLMLHCSCPDAAVPCKHLAAVFYLLAESFDDDPFAILAWRGRARAELLGNLQAARSESESTAQQPESGRALTDCLDCYFERAADVRVANAHATPSTTLLDQLPDIGVVVRGHPLIELLRPVYTGLGGPAISR